MDIGFWLHEQGLGQYAEAFRANDIDVELLSSLTSDDLKEIGVASLGHRRRLLRAIQALPTARQAPAPSPRAAERRQLTVMFVDLVGSTALSTALDPEDLRDVIATYQNAVAGEVARLEGHIAKFMGDGVLAYFGWPRAHEDEAGRAVRAGLAIIAAVAGIAGAGAALAARVGIATGLVVVGDLVGEGAARETAVVGDTPNLAARLQALAEPGQVVIARSTRRLLGDTFRVVDLGSRRLKGIGRPVQAFAVTGKGTPASRFAARDARLPPMVGRDAELAFLLENWERAGAGEGGAVLLVGEAGHGKSRIAQALVETLAGRPHHLLPWQCSPYRKDRVLWPVIQHLRQAAGLADDDSNEAAFAKLEAFLADADPDTEALPLLAELLGLDGEGRSGALELTPQARRTGTLRALVRRVTRLSSTKPVLVLLEDAHWSDPTTLELIELLLARIGRAPVLVLVTSRPEGRPRLEARPPVELLPLGRLGGAEVESFIRRLGGADLASTTIDAIAARADGVPLFVEELTKTVLELGDMPIPASLHDSLMARLDRIPEAREVAQIAACIGRRFDRALLAAIADRPKALVEKALDLLVRSELVFSPAPGGDGRFAFKHALVRDAAYESLLRSRRREVHGRIARALVASETERERAGPELVARHFLAADDPKSAIPHLLQAADRAIASAAGPEARETIRTGLAALETLEPDDTTIAWRARFHLLMGDSLRGTQGTAAAETGDAYRRARLAFAEIGDQDGQEMALFGEFLSHFNAARLDQAEEVTGLLRAAPSFAANPARHWHRHEASGLIAFVRGRFEAARSHFEALPDALGPYPDRPSAAQIYLPWSLFILGFPDRANTLEEAVLANAAAVGRKFTLAAALGNGCYLPQLSGRLELLAERARRCLEESSLAQLTIWQNVGSIFEGWLAGRAGEVERGLALMEPALQALDAAGHHIELGYLSSLRADLLLRMADREAARILLEEALARHARTGERWFDAELQRMLAAAAPDDATAERHLESALEIARRQQARLWELRAARDLARLWSARGERQRALDLLAPVYDGFTEGFATPDLIEAKAVLDRLA